MCAIFVHLSFSLFLSLSLSLSLHILIYKNVFMAQDGRTGLVMEHECNSEALTDDDVSMMVNNLNRACALAADPMRYRGMQASFLTIHPTNIYLSIYRSISLSVCLSICISICLCLSMYVCMYDDVQVQAMEASESFTWAAAVKQYEEEFKRIGAYMHK